MAVQNLMEVFGEETTSRLTGVSKRQLQRWDREGFFSPGFGYENCRDPVSPLYSFRDLVSLRVLRALRKEHRVPMTRLRTTKAKLLKLGDKLWAERKLYVHNRRVGLHNPKTDAIEEVVSGQGLLEIDLRVVSGERREAITIFCSRKAEQSRRSGYWRRSSTDGKICDELSK